MSCSPRPRYFTEQGSVFGTYYNIRYEATSSQLPMIQHTFAELDSSLSMFCPQSVISRINCNEPILTDSLFERVFSTAQMVSQLSDGAFDITVAPLVNAWGFGFKNRENVSATLIDSLLQFVDWNSIQLRDHRLIKQNPSTMLDASAIAKGFACDLVAERLRQAGATNILVDIGGEVVAHGVNEQGNPWRVGITKPIDDATCTQQELQQIIESSDIAMATSGNYRRFYYEDGLKRSHTIDPRTGYPVQHQLLSATIIAESCMLADALATTSMVLGTDSALALLQKIPSVSAYFIVADNDSTRVITYNMAQFLN